MSDTPLRAMAIKLCDRGHHASLHRHGSAYDLAPGVDAADEQSVPRGRGNGANVQHDVA